MKTIVAFMFLLTMVLVAGCGSDTPTDVARVWQKAILEERVDVANQYTAKGNETDGLNVMLVMSIADSEKDKKDFEDMVFDKEEINGENAIVRSSKHTVRLKRVAGEWKVRSF